MIYRQKGLNGQPEVLLDPNQFSSDGTSALTVFSLSKDGKYAAYGVSKGGSDWQELRVMEVATRKTLPDVVKWVKVSGASWQGDGFYYSRYPEPEKGNAVFYRDILKGQKTFTSTPAKTERRRQCSSRIARG